MERIIISLFCVSILLLQGCNLIVTETDDPEEFLISVRNDTGEDIQIQGYRFDKTLLFDELIENENSIHVCSALERNFIGFTCVDSLIFVFPSSKGYICSNFIETELCLPEEKDPFSFSNAFIDVGSNEFEFVLTSNDLLNAFDLSE